MGRTVSESRFESCAEVAGAWWAFYPKGADEAAQAGEQQLKSRRRLDGMADVGGVFAARTRSRRAAATRVS